jgi:hypothetical protein
MATKIAHDRTLQFALAALVAAWGVASDAYAKTMTSATYLGHYGAELRGFADDALDTVSKGAFNLSTIPAGATIVRATMYSLDVGSANSQNASFDGIALGAGTEVDSDGIFPMRGIEWDVTPLLTTGGSHSAIISSLDTTFGGALSVVYSHPSLPLSTVVVNSGISEVAPNLSEDTESTIFNNALIGPGAAKLSMFTFADDVGATNERIIFNGLLAGGPIDANLVVNAGELNSLFEMSVNAVSGVNTLTVTSPDNGDQFGFPVAILAAPMAVPEPATAGLVTIACLVAAIMRRRVR